MKLFLYAAIVLTMSACTSVGPASIQGSRTDYNVALQRTDDEQLLLNLVRLRYRDRMLFLESSALTTQFRFSASGQVFTELGEGDNLYGVQGGITVEENPTVTYTPLQGADFVQRVLAPVKQDTLFLLDTSGWSIERGLRVLVEQINGVKNAAGANGPTPERAPEYAEFQRLAGLFRELELRGMFFSERMEDGVMLRFDPQARSLPEYQELIDLLGLDPDLEAYRVSNRDRRASFETNVIDIRFRSFAGIMYFLSHSVDVPDRDIQAGRVTLTRDAAGEVFDWNRVTDRLMTIRSSDERPDNAMTAVYYRGTWFYIDDSDLHSKSTFSMLGQIFALQAGDVESITPMLTLPVGG
jgi:hypothetical protein